MPLNLAVQYINVVADELVVNLFLSPSIALLGLLTSYYKPSSVKSSELDGGVDTEGDKRIIFPYSN